MITVKKNWLILLIALIFIIFLPILFLGKLFPGFDLLLVFYPNSFHFFNSQNLLASGILSGFNLVATPSSFAGNWIYYFFAIKFSSIFKCVMNNAFATRASN